MIIWAAVRNSIFLIKKNNSRYNYTKKYIQMTIMVFKEIMSKWFDKFDCIEENRVNERVRDTYLK